MRVGGSTSLNKQTDLGIPQGEVLCIIFFLVEISGILGELPNGVDILLFADNQAIYITTRNQTLKEQILLYQEITQFLGIALDSRLNWEEHFDSVKAEAKIAINTKVLAVKMWGGDWKTIKNTVQCNKKMKDRLWLPTSTYPGRQKNYTAQTNRITVCRSIFSIPRIKDYTGTEILL